MSEITRTRSRVSHRLTWLTAALGTVAVLGGGVAVAGQLWDGGGAAVTTDFGCYRTADLEGDTVIAVTTDEDPVESCARMWEAGEIDPDTTTAPPLVACLLGAGPVGVFPGDGGDTCAELGLSPTASAAPEDAEQAIALRGVRDALAERFDDGAGSCVSEEEGVRAAEEEVEEHGLTGWRVSSSSFGEDRPCASLAIDEEAKTVLVVGVPDFSSAEDD